MSRPLKKAFFSGASTLLGPSNHDWINWFEDWTDLLKAQLPTLEALILSQDILKSHGGNRGLLNSLGIAQERLSNGTSLADSFDQLPHPVPTEVLLAFECGQQTGRISETCQEHLAAWKERILARQALIRSMAYPFLVLLASGFCWWLLDFTTAAVKQTLPSNSQTAWSLPDYLILAGSLLGMIVLPKALKDRQHRATEKTQCMPLGGLSPAKAWYISQFFFSIEQELQAGFDILHCLRHRPLRHYRPFVGQKATHQQLNLLNARLHQQLKDGGSFADAMNRAGAPDFMARHAKISEQTGDLASTYSTGVKLFQIEARKRQKRIQNLLGPITLMLAALTLVAAYQSSVAPLYNNLGVM